MSFVVPSRLQLLVSVRSVDEALAAMRGGADIIDIKEPDRGSLGAASSDVMFDICHALRDAGFSGPLSAALGELHELAEPVPFPAELAWVKAGLSHCRETSWQTTWQALQQQVRRQSGATELLAVVYADWEHCAAPSPLQVIEAAIAARCPGVLFDTFHKDGCHLLDHLPPAQLRPLIKSLRTAGLFAALAGSLGLEQFPDLTELKPDVVAVRSAACVDGRQGRVDAQRVAALRVAMDVACDHASAKRR